jgi:hypothetical protein
VGTAVLIQAFGKVATAAAGDAGTSTASVAATIAKTVAIAPLRRKDVRIDEPPF